MGKVYRNQGADRSSRRRKSAGQAPIRVVLVTVAAASAFATQYAFNHGTSGISISSNPFGIGCNIKGNISYYGGQKIYHVPGQEYYSETRINPLKGERWFCSEAEAQAAGWRRARR
ncbi:hypothetical protein P9272_35755 [Mesorhizobium sp. WSM4976]|uniref:sunset domain-containing protein n=1 Tax=Mesorhizobium sp. WSM4976 TaxID=3038549 RepID=UPI002416ED48|nr:hypothetical protein [Mesorhizobium sp. WSM4976]MDG4898839.1 hypothetical protein [Mesorhizobium sp. WSM4976]